MPDVDHSAAYEQVRQSVQLVLGACVGHGHVAGQYELIKRAAMRAVVQARIAEHYRWCCCEGGEPCERRDELDALRAEIEEDA